MKKDLQLLLAESKWNLSKHETCADMAGFPLTVLDSESTSYPMDELIRKAKSLYNDGMTLQDIHKTLVDEKEDLLCISKEFKRFICKWSCKRSTILLGSLLSVNLILEVKVENFYLKRKFVKSKNVESTLKVNWKRVT